MIGGLGITGASFEGRVTRAVNEGIELLVLGFEQRVKGAGAVWQYHSRIRPWASEIVYADLLERLV